MQCLSYDLSLHMPPPHRDALQTKLLSNSNFKLTLVLLFFLLYFIFWTLVSSDSLFPFCRRYTKFYGTSESSAINLAHDALMSMYFCGIFVTVIFYNFILHLKPWILNKLLFDFFFIFLDLMLNIICALLIFKLTYINDLFSGYKWWEEEIEKWQNPILKNENLPEW